MNDAFKDNSSITDLTDEELHSVFGAAAGDSYVCEVKNNQIVIKSCKKVD